jgi:hypothetical protein
MNAQFRIQDKIDETKQHLEALKELRDENEAWLQFDAEYDKGASEDKIKALINALDFAIDFIKWGMKK